MNISEGSQDNGVPEPIYAFGGFRLDPARRMLSTGDRGEPVALKPKQLDTLLCLVRNRGQLLDKARLLREVWPRLVVEENNLNQAISALRRALGESPGDHRYIVTVPGRGYKFVAHVRAITAVDDGHSIAPARNMETPRLAILPFRNLSPDPADEFFTDGLYEEMVSALVRQTGIEIVSRTTMMAYRNLPVPALELAASLGVSHVMEGSVRRQRDTVRMTLQLTDAHNGLHVWSGKYDRTLGDSLALQEEVAAEVAARVTERIAPRTERQSVPTVDPEAYDLYLKALVGRQRLNAFSPSADLRDVEELLDRAIARDPAFTLAYVQRAGIRQAVFAWNHDASGQQVERIHRDLAAAHRLSPDNPQVRAAEAQYRHWVELDLARSLQAHADADVLGLADPIWLATRAGVLARMGRLEEAVRINTRLAELDPGNPFLLTFSALCLHVNGDSAAALRVLARGLEFSPRSPVLSLQRAQIIFAAAGRTDVWRDALAIHGPELDEVTRLDQQFALLRLEGRYDEIRTLPGDSTQNSVRVHPGISPFLGVGQRPVAEYRGWTELLLGNAGNAARAGAAVLEHVSRRRETPWNRWFLRLLAAQGHAFSGHGERAVTTAEEALSLMPQSRDALYWTGVAATAAAICGWCSAQDRAVQLLEELAAARPGPGPAWISRDPLHAVPLAANPAFRALQQRLEERLAVAAASTY